MVSSNGAAAGWPLMRKAAQCTWQLTAPWPPAWHLSVLNKHIFSRQRSSFSDIADTHNTGGSPVAVGSRASLAHCRG